MSTRERWADVTNPRDVMVGGGEGTLTESSAIYDVDSGQCCCSTVLLLLI